MTCLSRPFTDLMEASTKFYPGRVSRDVKVRRNDEKKKKLARSRSRALSLFISIIADRRSDRRSAQVAILPAQASRVLRKSKQTFNSIYSTSRKMIHRIRGVWGINNNQETNYRQEDETAESRCTQKQREPALGTGEKDDVT